MAYQPKSYKKFVATAATATLVASAIVPVALANEATVAFTDVSAIYKDAVDYLVSENLSNGLTETEFGINANIKRGDAAIILAKALGIQDDAEAAPSGFSDVPTRASLAINSLKAAGVIKGKTATRFGFEDNLTRGEVALILANVKAYNYAGDVSKLKFTDVIGTRYASAVAGMVEAGITQGKTATSFGTGDAIKRGDFAIFIYKAEGSPALKANVDTLEINAEGNEFTLMFNRMIPADADIKWLADNYSITINGNAATEAQLTALKLEVKSLSADGKTLVVTHTDLDELGLDGESVELSIGGAKDTYTFEVSTDAVLESVMAITAKSIQVDFKDAVDTSKAVIAVKKGSVTTNIAKTTFSEDKKSAIVEFATALTAGDYTVSVTGLSEAPLTKTVTVEAEKLASITFASDVAVIGAGNTITTNVIAKNQYGEDVSAKLAASTVTATTSKGTATSISNKGKLTVTNAPAPYTVGEKVVVTVVDSATGLVATKTLTVAQAADVKTIELATLTTDNKDLVGKPVNVTTFSTNAGEYYLPITIKDQYGNVLKASEIAGVSVISSNSNIVNLASPTIVDTDAGTVIKFQSTGGTPTFGTAVITVVSSATGVTSNTTIQVADNAKLDSVRLDTPSTELKLTKATTLPVTVVDTYGKEVALNDLTITGSGSNQLTLASGTTITAVNATLSVVTDYVAKTTSVKVTPTAKNVILTATTVTGKSQNLSLVANDAPVVSGIKGIDGDFVSLLANDATLSTRLDGNVEFVDQYGLAIDAPAYDAAGNVAALDYTIAPKVDNAVTTANTPGTIVATENAGSETYVVTLKNAAGDVLDTEDVTVSVVDAAKLTEFGVSDVSKLYSVSGATSHAEDLDIFGLLNGKKVVVNQNMAVDFTATNGLLGVNATTGVYTPTTVDTKGLDVASTVQVLVEAGTNTYTITKAVTYSNAAPKATSLALELDEVTAAGVVQISPENGDNFVTGDNGLAIFATDQYGEVITTGYKFVVTNNDSDAGVSISTDGTLSLTGTLDAGDTFTINTTIDGITKSIKVIVAATS